MRILRRTLVLALSLLALLVMVSCGKKEATPPAKESAAAPADQSGAANPAAPAQPASARAVVPAPENPPPPSNSLSLPVGIKRRTGDLDEITKSRNLRALVLISPIS